MAITSTNPGGAIPPDYRKQRLTLSALEIGETITGRFTAASIPGANFTMTVASTNVTTATAALKSAIEAHVSEEVAGGSAWVAVTVGTASTYIDVFSLDADGELLFTSTPPGGGPTVVQKLWTGNSVAVAQVTTLVPQNVLTGDTFSVKINGKVISVVATADTAANVASLLQAAIAASNIPEWKEVVATVSSDTVTLTARTAGVPFTVTAGSTDAVGVEITTTTPGVAGTNATQQFSIPLSAAGTFEITFGDQRTTAIAVGASNTTVQTALQALSTIGSGNATVTAGTSGDGNDTVYTVTFAGTLAKTPVAQLIVDLISTKPLIRTTQQGATTGVVQNEKQTIEIGQGYSFTLTLDGQTTTSITCLPYTADTSSAIAGALGSLANVEQVTVTKIAQDSRNGSSTYQIEFPDYDGSANQSQLTASVYSASGVQRHRLLIVNTEGVLAVNERQKIALQGNATGGTFTLTYSGQTTSSLAYNASASTVQTALRALSSIGSGNVTVTGSAPWSVEFTGTLAAGDRPQITATSSLTGTSAANVTVTTTRASSGPNHWDTPENWLPVGVPATGDDVDCSLAAPPILYGLDQTGVTLASLRVSMSWAQGRIGLPRYNQAGFIEYRPRELTCGITAADIGLGDGSGPTKIALNTLSIATNLKVWDSGGSSESGVPCVTWRGSNTANVITVDGGEFGSAWWPDETAQISKLDQTGGSAWLKNTTIVDSLAANGNTFRASDCLLGGKPLNV